MATGPPLTRDQQQQCIDAVERNGGNITAAAVEIGVSRECLRWRIRQLTARGKYTPPPNDGKHKRPRMDFGEIATRPVYEPSPEEIHEGCLAIQARWSKAEWRHAGHVECRWEPPIVAREHFDGAVVDAQYAG